MLGYLLDTYDALKDEYRRWRHGPPPPRRPAPPSTPVPSPLTPRPPASGSASTDVPPVKRWSHPFGAQTDQLTQLTQLAEAVAGYYPVGRNGMWHGGVHFDKGTASLCDQSQVRCIADGEVVAYRIPEHTPKTTYFPSSMVKVEAPFASGFVLVRHRLEAPKLEGSPDIPPSLTFFSLYMHLQDWASYKDNTALQRPTFWPEDPVRRVKATANDMDIDDSTQRGLNLRHQPRNGTVIGCLPRGATVSVSGEGEYRKLEGSNGPKALQNSDGTLRGYVTFSYLQAVGDGTYRVNTNSGSLIVRAEPDSSSTDLFRLPKGAEIKVSGEGAFRKLEYVAQYVHFASLESTRKPQADGTVVVLDTPVPIQAGELIGHLGPYQEGSETVAQEKLHLEVFTAEEMPEFLTKSRAWAQRLPASGKTWLKVAGSTPVVHHQAHFSATQPPKLSDPSTPTGANLLIPKSVLDGLPASHKIKVPAADGRKPFNWYHLEGLLCDGAGTLLNGWVREEVDVTPWVNPWAWEGYDVIYSNDRPEYGLAYMMNALGRFDEEDSERNRIRVAASESSNLKTRLYDLIDKDRKNGITAEEMRAALRIPASAQSISQLIIYYESEWAYWDSKWDALDDVLGHTTSMPILNWVAEKERIKQLSWWAEVAAKGILPKMGKMYHFHPIGLAGWFSQQVCACGRDITEEELQKISPNSSMQAIRRHLGSINQGFSRFGITSCRAKAHFLAQVIHESDRLNAVREYNGEHKSYSPWYGRGLMQLTLRINYMNYGSYMGDDFSSSEENRNKLTQEPHSALSAFWFYKIYKHLDRLADLDDFNVVTAKINGGFNGYNDRVEYFRRAVDVLGAKHLARLESLGRFKFETSGIYENKIYSFAWGLWHDPSRMEVGVTKDRNESLAGYRRARELLLAHPLDESTPDKKIYGIRYSDVLPFLNQKISTLSD